MDKDIRMVNVKDIIKGDTAVSAELGGLVFDQIYTALKQESSIALDFGGVTLITTAFLNAAIGQLYKDFTSEMLNAHLKIVNVAPDDKPLFNLVIERSKLYFKDKKGFDTAANDAIYGG